MLEIATILLLALHLLAMNVASAGPLAAAWLHRRGDGAGGEVRALSRRVAKQSLVALFVGTVLGGAMILLPSPGLRAVLARFPADAYWFAGVELLFSAGCMGILLACMQRGRLHPALAWGLAAASATNLLYHFPPLMAVLGELAADPAWTADQTIERSALLRLWLRPEVLALWTHFVLASIAAAAIAALWLNNSRESAPSETGHGAVARRLAVCALAASLLQAPAGVWLLSVSNGAARDSILGEDAAASACFLAGMLTALWLLKSLADVALGNTSRAAIRRTGWLLMIVAVMMSATLRMSRTPAAAATSPPVQN